MHYERIIVIAIILSMSVAAFGPTCRAEPSPPARIGNVWGSTDHQPTRDEVRAAELKTHTALSPEQKHSEDLELTRIMHQLSRPE